MPVRIPARRIQFVLTARVLDRSDAHAARMELGRQFDDQRRFAAILATNAVPGKRLNSEVV